MNQNTKKLVSYLVKDSLITIGTFRVVHSGFKAFVPKTKNPLLKIATGLVEFCVFSKACEIVSSVIISEKDTNEFKESVRDSLGIASPSKYYTDPEDDTEEDDNTDDPDNAAEDETENKTSKEFDEIVQTQLTFNSKDDVINFFGDIADNTYGAEYVTVLELLDFYTTYKNRYDIEKISTMDLYGWDKKTFFFDGFMLPSNKDNAFFDEESGLYCLTGFPSCKPIPEEFDDAEPVEDEEDDDLEDDSMSTYFPKHFKKKKDDKEMTDE